MLTRTRRLALLLATGTHLQAEQHNTLQAEQHNTDTIVKAPGGRV